MKTTIPQLKRSITQFPCPLVLLLPLLAVACFALPSTLPAACNNGCFDGDNTTLGTNASIANAGSFNTAVGARTLSENKIGNDNTANGAHALVNNAVGSSNTAIGKGALFNNIAGNGNTAVGKDALLNNIRSSGNIALGNAAGRNLNGEHNIAIGNEGVDSESNTIWIGNPRHMRTFIAGISGVAVAGPAVRVNAGGQLGTAPSSQRFKEAIKPMDKASEAILALCPVTFRYKHEFDPNGVPQFGLVAEEVEKVDPALVDRDQRGKPYTVRYDAVNAMLLNEFLKQHKAFVEAQQKIEQLESTVESLVATVKEQSAQIQQVNAKLQLSKAGPKTVLNDR